MLFNMIRQFFYTRFLPVMRDITNKIKKIKKAILANDVAAPAIPLNPKIPAIIAIIINMIVQRNIM